MSRPSPRDALLDEAAALPDVQGVDAAEREQLESAVLELDRSAVQYHFGTRENLIVKLVERTMNRINHERTALLDHLEATRGTVTPRDAVDALIWPLSRQLATLEGRQYVRLIGQLVNHPQYNAEARNALGLTPSLVRCVGYLSPTMAGLPDLIMVERVNVLLVFAVRAIADQARLMEVSPAPRPMLEPDAFVTNLVDMIMAMVTAPSEVPAD